MVLRLGIYLKGNPATAAAAVCCWSLAMPTAPSINRSMNDPTRTIHRVLASLEDTGCGYIDVD